MNKYIRSFVFLLILSLILTVSACSSQMDEPEADVTDETFLSPEETTDSISGIWSTYADELTINRYFYNTAGRLVTVMQDSEDETWVILSYWDEEDDNITVNNDKTYKFDTDSGEWQEDTTDVIRVKSGKELTDDSIELTEDIPNGDTVTLTYERGSRSLEIPEEASIKLIINNFLEY